MKEVKKIEDSKSGIIPIVATALVGTVSLSAMLYLVTHCDPQTETLMYESSVVLSPILGSATVYFVRNGIKAYKEEKKSKTYTKKKDI